MHYEPEELLPLVERLANKDTAFESTSISYEKAEQLMGAVLYCINEAERAECNALQGNAITARKVMSARQAYETGLACVEKKVKTALQLYHKLLPDFICYGNRCLYETFVEGLPVFFQKYDSRFWPQNTILTLDYPLLEDISDNTGIDKICEFLLRIRLEQKFLQVFPEKYIIDTLSRYDADYGELPINLCEIVLMSLLARVLSGKPMDEPAFEEEDCEHIRDVFLQMRFQDINERLKGALAVFIQKSWGEDTVLLEYLGNAVDTVVFRLRNAAENDGLHRIL